MPASVYLSTSYFGPVQYFSKFLIYPERTIEQYDHYTKQTYRNRCNILGANGILSLSIPVLKGPDHKSYVRDIRIDYSKNWRKLHWKGIESAYRHSPFFEFYLDEIRGFLEIKKTFLIDLNLEIMDYLLESLEINGEYLLSGEFRAKTEADFREIIHPKIDPSADGGFKAVPYMQVFSGRHGFQPNLSILDLLFNEGPNAREILENCVSE